MAKHCPALMTFAKRMRRFAAEGPKRFQWFMASDEFSQRFNSIPPEFRRRAIQAIAEAEACVHDGLPPPVKRRRMGDGPKCNWKDPALRAKLARVYAICGDDHDKAGRMMRITADAARIAKGRVLGAHATLPMAQAA